MPILFDRNAEPRELRLEGEVDISEADELKRVLLEALEGKRAVHVAMERATVLDITAMQLLWAAEREAGKAGVALVLRGTLPEALRAAVAEAGFARFPLADEPALSPEVR